MGIISTLSNLRTHDTNNTVGKQNKKEKKRRRDTKRRAKTLKASMSTFFLREGETEEC